MAPFIVTIKEDVAKAARWRCIPLAGMVPAAPTFGLPAYHLAQAVAAFDALPLAQRVKHVLASQLGVTESPAGSNRGPMVDQYIEAAGLKPPEPWCACFQTWGLKHALYGGPLPPSPGYVPSWEAWAKANKRWVAASATRAGDYLLYCWDGSGVAEHIGFCTGASGQSRFAIEGNTAVGNDSNGGEVMLRTRVLANVLGGVRL